MRVLIYGAGAIGGYVGALLAQQGVDVTLLARGATYEAISTGGLRLDWAEDGRSLQVKVKACRPGEADGPYDLVFVTLKSMQLAAAARDIQATVSPDGCLVMVQNGLPWWYFDRIDSPLRGTALRSLDPEGVLATSIDLDRVLGAVIYKPATVVAPGRIFLPDVKLNKLIIGELDGHRSARAEQVATLVTQSGLPVDITDDIRAAKWAKLMLNLVWNPLSALTQSAAGAIAAVPLAADLVRAMLAEGVAVAASVGVSVRADAEAELRRVAGNFTQQTSMLQDVRAGRPLEWEAILGAVIEIARLTDVPVPTLKNIAGCIGVLDQVIRREAVGIAPTAPGPMLDRAR